MNRAFTTYCDVKNYDLEVKFSYSRELDEMSVDRVMMGKYDVTAPFMEYCSEQIEDAVWGDIHD